MICPSCKTDNIEGADECANCGQSLYGLDLPGAELGEKAPAFVQTPLSVLQKRPIARVNRGDPVSLAVRRMQTENSNAVLVMDGERLAGIISTWDILHKVASPHEDLLAVTCAQIMSPDPVVFLPDDSLALVINKMSTSAFRHAPVIDPNGTVVNVVDITDVFAFISTYLV